MTKPATPKLPRIKRKADRGTPSRVIKRTPAHRLALILTPTHATLAERHGSSFKEVTIPFSTQLLTSSGISNRDVFLVTLRELRQKLGSKAKHVDLHLPMMFFHAEYIASANIPPTDVDDLIQAAEFRLASEHNIRPNTHTFTTYAAAHQSAAHVISAEKSALKNILDAMLPTGLIPVAIVPTIFTELLGLPSQSDVTAVVHFEPGGCTVAVIQDTRLLRLTMPQPLNLSVTRTAKTAGAVEAYNKLLSSTNWDPSEIVRTTQSLITEANDELRSFDAPTIDTVLVTGALGQHPLLIDALHDTIGALNADTLTPGNQNSLLLGAVATPSTDRHNPRSINLLSTDLKPTRQTSTPNIGLLLPAALTAGWVAYACTTGFTGMTTAAQARDRQVTLTDLQRFAAEQQNLQLENTRMSTQLSMRNQIEASTVAWPNIIARFTRAIPTTNAGFVGTISSFDVRPEKPDALKYGSLPVAYAYDVTVNAASRANLLRFIDAYSSAPFAIDVQNLTKTPDNTWAMRATVGTTK